MRTRIGRKIGQWWVSESFNNKELLGLAVKGFDMIQDVRNGKSVKEVVTDELKKQIKGVRK